MKLLPLPSTEVEVKEIKTLKVQTVLFTSVTARNNSSKPTKEEFKINDIVVMGKNYGIVTKINPDSWRPLVVSWDEDNEKFAYTIDEIKVLNIQVVPQIISGNTFCKIPPHVQILLTDGTLVTFNKDAVFFVESADNNEITICNSSERFPLVSRAFSPPFLLKSSLYS